MEAVDSMTTTWIKDGKENRNKEVQLQYLSSPQHRLPLGHDNLSMMQHATSGSREVIVRSPIHIKFINS
nr:expressed protein [Hymenolepis microstoma]